MCDTPAKIFMTFGSNHRDNDGNSLINRYALFASREQAFEVWGPAFCTTYPIEDLPEMLSRYPMTEISHEEINEGRRAE